MPIYNHFCADQNGKVGGEGSALRLVGEGALLPVLVSTTSWLATFLHSIGKAVPAAVQGLALLDTGAAYCAIDQDVPRQMGVPPVGYLMTLGATSPKPIPAFTYPASLSFPTTNLPNITFQDFLGLPLKSQGIIALIGRTVLKHFVMVYNGPCGIITLSH